MPRTAIGQRADGKILLVAVDGKQPGYSVGVTNFELALAMMQLGAVTASALDAGGSTTMAFDGQLLSRPSDPAGERPVADALLVAYTGVYVAPPAEPVLSPNDDGVAELESLSYKVVRPSTVQASLVGPGRRHAADRRGRAGARHLQVQLGGRAAAASPKELAVHGHRDRRPGRRLGRPIARSRSTTRSRRSPCGPRR